MSGLTSSENTESPVRSTRRRMASSVVTSMRPKPATESREAEGLEPDDWLGQACIAVCDCWEASGLREWLSA